MSRYLEIVFRALIIVIPLFILLKGNNLQYRSVFFLLCYACTYGYSYELFGAISVLHILLVFSVVFKERVRNDIRTVNTGVSDFILLYIVHVSFVTIIGYYIKSDYLLRGSIIQNQLRPYVQIAFMIMTYLAIDSVRVINADKSKTILVAFYKVTLFLSVVAIAQEALFLATGYDMFPMLKDYGGQNGVSAISANGLLRATAGVGEPKQLAKFLSLGLSFHLLCHNFLGYKKIKTSHLILFGIAILFTGSITGILIAFVGIVMFFKSRAKGKVEGLLVVCLVLLLAVPVVLSLPAVQDKFEYAASQGEIVGLENSDTATVRFLLANPLYSITGVGLANTVAYANEYAPIESQFINNYPYTLRRGIIFHIAETGIIGLLLQLAIFKRIHIRIKGDTEKSNMFIFLEVVYMFLTLEAINQLLLLMMVLLSNCKCESSSEEESKVYKYV